MANFICKFREQDGTEDEFRVVAASLEEAEVKAMEQLMEDLGYDTATAIKAFRVDAK